MLVATAVLDAIHTAGRVPDVIWAVGPLAIVALSEDGGHNKTTSAAFVLLFSCMIAWWVVPNFTVGRFGV
jgi:hypothetical protein